MTDVHGTEDASRLRLASPQALGRLMSTEPHLVAALRGSSRTGERLVTGACARLGQMPGTVSPAQNRLLGMEGSALAALSTQVGIVLNAAALLRIIDGAILRELTAALGRDAVPLAIRWSHMVAEAPAPVRGASLTEQVQSDGLQGLHGWCTRQPPVIGERVRLLLVPSGSGTVQDDALGARIVDALVTADA